MKQQLLSIADYLESLEQRIAALEDSNHALQSANLALQDTINALQDKLDNLAPIEPIDPLEPIESPDPEPVLQPATCNLQPALGSVSNIRQAISLGDRFLFQRELFANNGELMQKTLDDLDACANLDEALQRISSFNWDQESTTYKLFLNVLKRRF